MFVPISRFEGMLKRRPVYGLSRAIIVALVLSAVGSLFWSPDNAFTWCLDILMRTYLMFLGTVMAHEGTHGHLGRTRTANFWWGRGWQSFPRWCRSRTSTRPIGSTTPIRTSPTGIPIIFSTALAPGSLPSAPWPCRIIGSSGSGNEGN